jgi:hypothetical protein
MSSAAIILKLRTKVTCSATTCLRAGHAQADGMSYLLACNAQASGDDPSTPLPVRTCLRVRAGKHADRALSS